ncbi:MAG: vWA domain-containing protein [Planctomycetota bacterium]
MVETEAHSGVGGNASWTDFDDERWRRRMQRSDIAAELFIPLNHGDWTKAKFRLIRGEGAQAKTGITGVRFLAADPRGESLEPERAVQNDFHRLVDSLITLRREPDWQRLCLSRETFRTTRGFGAVPRRQFGIVRGGDAKLESDTECAKRSYAAIRTAIRRAGFIVLDPKTRFDASTGLVGLRGWVDQLRLRKRRRWWLWLLLLPLLLLIPKCEAAEFFGARIETRSFVLVIDRSSSMREHFEALRREASRLLADLAQRAGVYANVISYCGSAESCLGDLQPIDESTRPRLEQFLRELGPGGGTVLQNALDLAGEEIVRHQRPTTLIVLTDAEDSSIASMIADRAGTTARFGEVETKSIALTPRLFRPQGASRAEPERGAAVPRDETEQRFAELAELLGGRFGGAQERP